MISESLLNKALQELLGRIPARYPTARLADRLSREEVDCGFRLSPYGYLLYVMETYGEQVYWANFVAAERPISEFRATAVDIREDTPSLLLNAAKYTERLMGSIPDVEICLDRLGTMSPAYVLYVLFAGADKADYAARFKEDALEKAKRHPAAYDLLPGKYGEIGKELVRNADSAQQG